MSFRISKKKLEFSVASVIFWGDRFLATRQGNAASCPILWGDDATKILPLFPILILLFLGRTTIICGPSGSPLSSATSWESATNESWIFLVAEITPAPVEPTIIHLQVKNPQNLTLLSDSGHRHEYTLRRMKSGHSNSDPTLKFKAEARSFSVCLIDWLIDWLARF